MLGFLPAGFIYKRNSQCQRVSGSEAHCLTLQSEVGSESHVVVRRRQG